MRHGCPLFSWDCVSGSSQRCESSSRRAMKLSHKLRGGDVYELLTEESPDIADRKWMNQWTNEANAFQRCVGVIWLMTSLQCWNMLIFYCSNSMASVNVPPPHFVWWFACCSEFDRKKGAEMWQAGGHVFHVFASKNQRIAGVLQYCHWLKWSNWLILDHCFAPASKPLGQSWASLKAGSAHA